MRYRQKGIFISYAIGLDKSSDMTEEELTSAVTDKDQPKRSSSEVVSSFD